MNWFIRIAAILLAITMLIIPPIQAQQSSEDSPRARGLYRSGQSDGMSIYILKSEAGKLTPVDPRRNFHSGDAIKIAFETNFDGYVYVVNITPLGKKQVLFPYASEKNLIRAAQRYELPTGGTFNFDEEKGTEVVQVIMSREPIAFLDAAIKNGNGEFGETNAVNAPNNTPTTASVTATQTPAATAEAGIICDNVESVLPPGTVRGRKIILGRAKEQEKDKESSIIAIPDDKDPTLGGRLRPGEAAIFQLRLQHI